MGHYRDPIHPSHEWGVIGNFTICKKCACGDWSPKSSLECNQTAKLRPMEKQTKFPTQEQEVE